MEQKIGFILQSKFMDECPAFFRKLGVDNWLQWVKIKKLMPLDWSDRFDLLYEWKSKGFEKQNWIIEKALRAWDEM